MVISKIKNKFLFKLLAKTFFNCKRVILLFSQDRRYAKKH